MPFSRGGLEERSRGEKPPCRLLNGGLRAHLLLLACAGTFQRSRQPALAQRAFSRPANPDAAPTLAAPPRSLRLTLAAACASRVLSQRAEVGATAGGRARLPVIMNSESLNSAGPGSESCTGKLLTGRLGEP